jgi:hypothetical protein
MTEWGDREARKVLICFAGTDRFGQRWKFGAKGQTDQQMLFNPWYVFNLWLNLFRAMVFVPWAAPLQAAQVAWGAHSRTARDLTRFSEGIGKRSGQLAEAQRSQPPAEESHPYREAVDRFAELARSRVSRRHKPRSRIRAAGTGTITRTQRASTQAKSKRKKRPAVRRAR